MANEEKSVAWLMAHRYKLCPQWHFDPESPFISDPSAINCLRKDEHQSMLITFQEEATRKKERQMRGTCLTCKKKRRSGERGWRDGKCANCIGE